MGQIAGIDVGIDAPSFVDTAFSTYLLYTIIVVALVAVLAMVIYMLYTKKLFNKKVILFENVSGQGWVKTGVDTARMIKVGTGGEEILFLRKRKVYRTAYGRKMGDNTYWFAVGQDGYWYNFVLGDLDAKLGMLDIEPVDRDMRYMHVAIRKNTQDRYNKVSFMEKYGTMIMLGIYMVMFFIGSWFLLDQLGEIAKSVVSAVDSVRELVGPISQALSKIDSINSGGTGVTAAIAFLGLRRRR